MNEEIGIIELLKRVQEGKAPRKIQIGATIYELNGEPDELEDTDIEYLYLSEMNERIWIDDMQPKITIQTKIKILDKPIIDDIKINIEETKETFDIKTKLNEIIRCLNKVLEKYNIDKI